MNEREKQIERLKVLYQIISELEYKADLLAIALEIKPLDLANLKHQALEELK